ncbi:MAG: DEAD/DEAH box helicase [Anaerolineales bacterium]|nr:DEAD/DEAH box helicase [Anaerolineales bacterium]
MSDAARIALQAFSPAVRAWFRDRFGAPTPPQAEGWPAIQRGGHTLILAPTGSGKTLAAFLWGIDELCRELQRAVLAEAAGVRLLYVSPLKALNNDIERNLRAPLDGIRAAAERLGQPLPPLHVAVRTGDTPQSVRAQMVKRPPHILITTPESLYLILTSPRARAMFRTIRSVIVDEIHTLVGNKRGAHLALSLERLAHLAQKPVQRIGLSATIRPLDEAARFLGGQLPSTEPLAPGPARPVTVVNAHYRKALDLEVVTVVDDFRALPGDTIWPSVVPRVLDDIRRHHTTLIFANNRRLAERTADRLNAQLEAEQSEEVPPGSREALAPGGIVRDSGMFAIGAEGPFRAHHGSLSKEARLKLEDDLKAGRLPALVGTSSLELGIDIGAVEVVVQLQSPKSVSQGLQRVGRSGHLVGQTSRGRIYPTFREDLVEAAAIARGMLEGDVEPTYAPKNPLDVLAQQVVAMVAMEDWQASELYALVRQAYPYQSLPRGAFDSVLDMLTGAYALDLPSGVRGAAASLRPKIAWDRVHDRLTALPGSRLLALSNAGTIPGTGAYAVYLGDGKTRLGELDEEFVFETRVGDVFLLGSNVWRVIDIDNDRLLVAGAAGATPRMPFWNGDYPYRPYALGARLGRFRREAAERIAAQPAPEVEAWLRREYALDENSARNLVEHIRRQLDAAGVISSDTTIVAESFQNALGDPYLVIHSPYGGRVNGAWGLALLSAFREKTGVLPEAQTNDDGLIFRFAQAQPEVSVDVIRQLTPEAARERLLWELPESAVFGARFRMNAGRALLMPRARGRQRTPFWLQRLRAKDLLALVRSRHFDEFPILVETYRDCLQDVFDLPHLEELLGRIQSGEVQVVSIETATPSPVAADLLFNFAGVFLYEWDAPKAERQLQALSLSGTLAGLVPAAEAGPGTGTDLSSLLSPEAIAEVVQRAQHQAPGYQARTLEELAYHLRELGDRTTAEVAASTTGGGEAWLQMLMDEGRAMPVTIQGEQRWVSAGLAAEYGAAVAGETPEAAEAVLRRYLRHAGPVTREAILQRYPFEPDWLEAALARLGAAGEVVAGRFTGPELDEVCDAHTLDQIRRRTLAQLRQAVQPVPLEGYASFLARWQHVQPDARPAGPGALRQVLEQLRGLALPWRVWEREVLPARLDRFDPAALEALGQGGELVWAGAPSGGGHFALGRREGEDQSIAARLRRGRIRLFFRGEGALFFDNPDEVEAEVSPPAQRVLEFLRAEGASFAADLQAGLALTAAALTAALAELAAAGLVTHDSFDALRALQAAEDDGAAEARSRSALEEELAARLGDRARPLTAHRYRQAKQRVAQRLRGEALAVPSRPSAPPVPAGRWALVNRAGVLGAPLSAEERAERLARALLARYGVVSRDSLERETGLLDWAQLYPVFQRFELRGEVRRGYFVAGLAGAQFALPAAVELLRSAPDQGAVVLNAVDPANVYGGDLGVEGAPRFARVPSTHVALVRGRPVVVFEDNGDRITTWPGVEAEAIQSAVQAYVLRPSGTRRVAVTHWNGQSVAGSDGEALLRAAGFGSTPGGLEWRPAP